MKALKKYWAGDNGKVIETIGIQQIEIELQGFINSNDNHFRVFVSGFDKDITFIDIVELADKNNLKIEIYQIQEYWVLEYIK